MMRGIRYSKDSSFAPASLAGVPPSGGIRRIGKVLVEGILITTLALGLAACEKLRSEASLRRTGDGSTRDAIAQNDGGNRKDGDCPCPDQKNGEVQDAQTKGRKDGSNDAGPRDAQGDGVRDAPGDALADGRRDMHVGCLPCPVADGPRPSPDLGSEAGAEPAPDMQVAHDMPRSSEDMPRPVPDVRVAEDIPVVIFPDVRDGSDAPRPRPDAPVATDGPGSLPEPPVVADAGGPDASSPDAPTQSPDAPVAQPDQGTPDQTPTRQVRRVVLARLTGGAFKVHVWDEGTGAITQLSSGPGHDLHPTWCVVGGRATVVFEFFESFESEQNARIFRMDMDFSTTPPTATAPLPVSGDGVPELNPQCAESGRIYYARGNDIHSINLDGGSRLGVFTDPNYTTKRSPGVTADESQLVFSAELGGDPNPRVYRIPLVAGVAIAGPPETLRSAASPSISPDGRLIAFNVTGPQVVIASAVDGSGELQITDTGTNGIPRFARPNGGFVTFHSDQARDINGDPIPGWTFTAFIAPADGSAPPANLVPGPSDDRAPELYVFTE